jgi:hypothetical protein
MQIARSASRPTRSPLSAGSLHPQCQPGNSLTSRWKCHPRWPPYAPDVRPHWLQPDVVWPLSFSETESMARMQASRRPDEIAMQRPRSVRRQNQAAVRPTCIVPSMSAAFDPACHKLDRQRRSNGRCRLEEVAIGRRVAAKTMSAASVSIATRFTAKMRPTNRVRSASS